MIILDTDIMIDLLRQHPPAVTWLDSLGEEEIILPGFVVMELLQGCSNKTEQVKVEKILTGFEIVWPLPETCEAAKAIICSPGLLGGVCPQGAFDSDPRPTQVADLP